MPKKLAAKKLRKKAYKLLAKANDLDDKNGVCRCIGLQHRTDCPEWTRPW